LPKSCLDLLSQKISQFVLLAIVPESTQEYPSHDDNLDLDASKMAMLELLVLCDSSVACCGFYDDLLTLLR
jgi:hypothetical protein